MTTPKPSKVYSAALTGLDAQTVEVEADVSIGLNSFQVVGLPDKAVDEAKERISAALKNCQFKHPRGFNKRTVINLAPADLKKEGGMYDLPLALSFLLASEQARFNPGNYLFAGELGLDGTLRPIKGALLLAMHAKDSGIPAVVVPHQNKKEVMLVEGIQVIAPRNLADLIQYLEKQKWDIQSASLAEGAEMEGSYPGTAETEPNPEVDMAHIAGQQHAKNALEIAAAGGHNIMMQGPPGSGKTILAKAFAGILPKMSRQEMLQVTKIYSLAGKVDPKNPLITTRPFRSPHHTASEPALIGGGANLKPGEITLAHHGVLFADEFPEFHRDVLESLRQPVESGFMTVGRARGFVTYPAKFILVAAANPCPCGFLHDPEKACTCFGMQLQRYQKKLSGPIADRIDIHIQVPHQTYDILTSDKVGEASAEVRKRVEAARSIQTERFFKENQGRDENKEILCNSQMGIPQVKTYCRVPAEAETALQKAVDKDRLSGRGYHKVLKIARTIADLAGREKIETGDIALAIRYNASVVRNSL